MSKLPTPSVFLFYVDVGMWRGGEEPGERWIRLREEGGKRKDEGKVNEECRTTGKGLAWLQTQMHEKKKKKKKHQAHAGKKRDGETAVKSC